MVYIGTVASQQDLISPNNDIDDPNCNCYEIVNSCTNQILEAEGFITVNCHFLGDRRKTRRSYKVEDGKVCIGNIDERWCLSPTIRLDIGNWEVCNIDGCTIYAFQTLPENPTINGQNLGYGYNTPGGNGSAYGECYKIHSGALNTIWSPSVFQLCAGEEAILNIPGYDPTDQCLHIRIKDLEGNTIAQETYTESNYPTYNTMVNGENINITDLLSNVGDDLYIIEMQVGCCSILSSINGIDGAYPACTPNTYKYAYFKLRKGFTYTPYLSVYPFGGGAGSSFPLFSFPDGPNIGDDPKYFVGFQGLYPQTSEPITVFIKVTKKVCGSEDSPIHVAGWNQVVNPGDDAFAGGFVINNFGGACLCYTIEVKYSDGCSLGGAGMTVDKYYFKSCPEDGIIFDEGDLEKRNVEKSDFKLLENPIQYNELKFGWNGEDSDDSVDLQIFDSNGRLIKSEWINMSDHSISIPFDEKSGIYIYRATCQGENYTGKIIKIN